MGILSLRLGTPREQEGQAVRLAQVLQGKPVAEGLQVCSRSRCPPVLQPPSSATAVLCVCADVWRGGLEQTRREQSRAPDRPDLSGSFWSFTTRQGNQGKLPAEESHFSLTLGAGQKVWLSREPRGTDALFLAKQLAGGSVGGLWKDRPTPLLSLSHP